MTSDATGMLDAAYERLHDRGPEFGGWLANHGPMAAEAIVRRGHADALEPWLEAYLLRLEDFPRGLGPIGSDWQAALGDPRRIADWTALFGDQLREDPWRQVLNTWWPRLLPGVAAAATHGVIRVGHVTRCLLTDGADEARIAELAHALGYWAARWQSVPAGHPVAAAAAASRAAASQGAAAGQPAAATRLQAAAGPRELLDSVPRIPDQSGGVRDRLVRLGELPGWPAAAGALAVPPSPADIRARLADLVDAATLRYLSYGHGNGVMLVHSATAPNAILRTLPALDPGLWAPSLTAAWAASSALTAVYSPARPAPRPAGSALAADGQTPAEAAANAMARAVEHGDEHVIKFADTAVEVFARTGNPDALAAARRAAQLIEP